MAENEGQRQEVAEGAQSQQGTAQSGQTPPTYLWQSIVVTVLCCLPLGIPAIVFAAQVNSKVAAGDIAGAEESSRKARQWCWIAFIAGLVAIVISIIIQVATGMAAFAG